MNDLYAKLQDTSIKKYNETHHDKLESMKAFDERLDTAITNLTEQIKIEAIDRMEKASELGQFSCVLYECAPRDKFNEEFRTLYILRGPLRWRNRVTFFERKRIASVISRLGESFNPIDVYLRYDRQTGNTLVCASWKTT